MVKTDMQKIQTQPSKQMKTSTSPTPSSSSSCKKNKYKGVRMRSWGSWVSEIRAPNQKTRIWLGSYSTAEAAARAYDAALLCLKGPSASFNFPITSSHYIPDTLLSDPKSIQRMAAAAANSFVDHAAVIPPISPPPSSSSASSPSMSSSPSPDQVVDDDDDDYVSLIQSLVANDEPISLMEPWYPSFDSCLQYSPTMINDFYEEADDDIRLWSFC